MSLKSIFVHFMEWFFSTHMFKWHFVRRLLGAILYSGDNRIFIHKITKSQNWWKPRMNTTRSSFDFRNTPRTSWIQCGHTPVNAEDMIVEPDPIGPPDRITVVPAINSVPISLQRDMLRLLAIPTVMSKISWQYSLQGNDQQQDERVTTINKSQYQLQRRGQPPAACSLATLCVSQRDLSPKESDRTYAPVFSLQSDGCMSPLLFSFMQEVPNQPEHGMLVNPTTTTPQRSTQQEQAEKRDTTSTSTPATCLRISELQQTKWMAFFLALCDYKMKHGNFNVPVATSCLHYDAPLGLWVKRLRHQYKRYHQGKHSSLTPERVELLSSVGFQWQVQDDMWHNRFRQLEEFAQKYGHIRVPLKGSTAGLHNWIKRQRKQYRLFKEGKTSAMPTERYEKLRILWSCFSDDNRSFGY